MNVIISEKRDKKAAKYLVKDLPYPYTSKAQFERAMDAPIGPEWNTRVGFQRGTLPRVVKKVCLCYFEGQESNEFICSLVSPELSLNRWRNSHDLTFM